MHPTLFCLQEYPLWSFFYGSDIMWDDISFFPLAKKKEILKNFSAPNNFANITAVWEKT